MQAIINSFLLVAATEMGDKTQLLAFLLVTKFRRPWVIMGGILTATILNHALAAFAGEWLAQNIPSTYLKYVLAITFFAFAAWILIPDKEGDDSTNPKFGAYLTTVVTFFIAEMGDKTQLSTFALAAKYQSILLVTIGTSLGMLFSDGLAVFFGRKVVEIIPLKWIHLGASILYIAFGIAILIGY